MDGPEARDAVVGGTGNSTVLGGAGSDLFDFLNDFAGGSETIEGFTVNDSIAFGGYSDNPIVSEHVVNGSDLIVLTDSTHITLLGFDHKVF